MLYRELSMHIDEGGTSAAVAISSTSAQSAAIATGCAVVYLTVDAFARSGSDPTALATGVDQIIPAATLLRLTCKPGHKFAFKTSGAAGTAYVTPCDR